MDDKTKTGSPDSKRININEKHEVSYWTKELGSWASRNTSKSGA